MSIATNNGGHPEVKNILFCLTISVRIFFAGVITLLANVVLANDGFYQGSGSTLKLVKNAHLRVREENLLIAPIFPPECYSVYANGKAIVDIKNGDRFIYVGWKINPSPFLNGADLDPMWLLEEIGKVGCRLIDKKL